jgi:hypothetical protein
MLGIWFKSSVIADHDASHSEIERHENGPEGPQLDLLLRDDVA